MNTRYVLSDILVVFVVVVVVIIIIIVTISNIISVTFNITET